MKKLWMTLGITVLTVFVLAGCGGATGAPAPAPAQAAEAAPAVATAAAAAPAAAAPAAAVPASGSTTALDTTYEGALSQRNQLLLGTLLLEESDWPVAAEQARTLLPLWQGIRGTMRSGAAAQAEVDALLRQIEASMTADQIAAIREMKLTQAELQAWAKNQGLSIGTGEGAGAGVGQGGGQALSAEARATRQAERGGTGEGGGLSQALVDAVIAYVESK